MGLINPWLLLGLASIAVPVLVHLVQREEHSGQKFPSLMFVRRIPFELKRRRRFRDQALLALRCLALTAVVIAFAAPYFRWQETAASASAIERDLVILIDRSYSMSHAGQWDRAKAVAARRIDQLAPGERAALVAFEDQPKIIAELTSDKTVLNTALERLEPGDGRTGYAAAFGAANRMLALSQAGKHGVVIISDLQRSALDESGALPLGERTALEVFPIGGPLGANVTVTDARLAPRGDAGVEDTLEVRIENTGDARLIAARLDLIVDGRIAKTQPFDLAAGEARILTLSLVLSADRPTPITLKVGPDALPADDRYHLVLAPRRPIAVAIIEPLHSRAHQGVFIEEALRLARGPQVKTRRLRLDKIEDSLLADFDVVVLDDVPVAPGPESDAIAAFVERGGGVLAVAGPSLGAAWPGGNDGYLPGTLGAEAAPVDFAGRIIVDGGKHPLWSAPGVEMGKALTAAKIGLSRKLIPNPQDRVLARLENGMPLLLERSNDSGRTLALSTTADPRWGTLALEPGFVPFVQAAVAYLAGRSEWTTAYLAGNVVNLFSLAGHVPGGSDWRTFVSGGGAVVVETPSGVAERIQPRDGAFFAARQAGMHEAHRADGKGPALPFAVNVTRAESLLNAASPAELERRIVRRARSVMMTNRASAGAGETDSFGSARWLLLIAALALVVESIVANRLSRRRNLVAKESAA